MTAPSIKEASELKPCPFCSKQPQSRWHGATGEDDDSGYWGIDCCQAFSHAGTEKDAVDNWNRRAALATLSPPAGERREAIARVAYEGRHKGLSNCWKWDDAELDREHPGSRDMYYAIADAILAVQDEVGWRDISTAPKDGRMVQLIFEPVEDPGMGFGIYRDGKWIASALFYRLNSGMKPPLEFRELEVTPTHWMPLPTPPIRSARDGGAES